MHVAYAFSRIQSLSHSYTQLRLLSLDVGVCSGLSLKADLSTTGVLTFIGLVFVMRDVWMGTLRTRHGPNESLNAELEI